MNKKNWSYWSIIKNKPTISICLLIVIVAIVAIAITVICKDPKNTTLYISVFALAISGISFVFSIIVPIIKGPILYANIEESPIFSKSRDKNPSSWFHRIMIINDGLTTAENCIGKLVEIRDEEGRKIEKYDPLPLYWTHQNKNTGFRQLSVFGRGDYAILDILQEKEVIHESECKTLNNLREDDTNIGPQFAQSFIDATENSLPILKVYLPEPEQLAHNEISSFSPGSQPILIPGTYYLFVGIYANNSFSKPEWYKLEIDLSSRKEVENIETSPKSKTKLTKAKKKDIPKPK